MGWKNEGLVDGFVGVIKKNVFLYIEWDGLDDFGKSVNLLFLIFYVEVVREYGG